MPLHNYELLLWDLDNTLSDPRTFGESFLHSVVNVCDWTKYNTTPEQVTAGLWKWSFFDAMREMKIPKQIQEKMLTGYRALHVPTTAKTFADVLPTFQRLQISNSHLKHVLVTKGFVDYQLRKVDALGLRSLFSEVIVVDVEDSTASKLGTFKRILEEGYQADKVLVIGDSREEIEAGCALGLRTIQTLRPSVTKVKEAHMHITHLDEIFNM